MVDRNKILSDLSKFAVDAMSTFSGVKEEIETIVSLRVNKIIKKMNLVKKDEFDALKKMVQKVIMENVKLKKMRTVLTSCMPLTCRPRRLRGPRPAPRPP